MDDTTLQGLEAVVTQAKNLKKQIEELEDFIKCSTNTVGYLNIQMNYNNQNQIDIGRILGPTLTFDLFKADLRAAAEKAVKVLKKQYDDLKIGGK